jgi:hypothetical protein
MGSRSQLVDSNWPAEPAVASEVFDCPIEPLVVMMTEMALVSCADWVLVGAVLWLVEFQLLGGHWPQAKVKFGLNAQRDWCQKQSSNEVLELILLLLQ